MNIEILEVAPGVRIPLSELRYQTSRSSGPGGQNVNKVETRVTLLFDLEGSPSLDEARKARLRERLATRINRAGILRVVSQRHRTQAANRQAATERFVDLVAAALVTQRPRRKTRPSRSAKRRRLEEKKRQGRRKSDRRARDDWD